MARVAGASSGNVRRCACAVLGANPSSRFGQEKAGTSPTTRAADTQTCPTDRCLLIWCFSFRRFFPRHDLSLPLRIADCRLPILKTALRQIPLLYNRSEEHT